MGENSSIEWCHHTFNPWVGCEKVSPGCANCYAEAMMDKRYGKVKWGKDGTRNRTSASNWKQPLKWNREAKDSGERQRVFCASLADVFEDREELMPWRRDLFNLVYECQSLDWLVLTKRPYHARLFMGGTSGAGYAAWPECFPHVWLGTSVEDQRRADERIPLLLQCPAAVLFLSCEPLLGPIDLSCVGPHRWDVLHAWKPDVGPEGVNTDAIDWVIDGGESGSGARRYDFAWSESLQRQCRDAGVAYFRKQIGSNAGWTDADGDWHAWPTKNGKGGDPSEWPDRLKSVRQFPKMETTNA
jgi:protein gp37